MYAKEMIFCKIMNQENHDNNAMFVLRQLND